MTPGDLSEQGRPDPIAEAPPDSYRVVVFGHVDDPTIVKEILVQFGGVHPEDAMAAAHLTPGILRGHFPKEIAETVATQIGQHGASSIAVSQADIPKIDHARMIHHARVQAEGLVIVGIHSEVERLVSWPDLSLLSAGSVPMEGARHFSAEPAVVLHAAPNPHPGLATTSPHSAVVLWLAVQNPWKVYRLIHNEMSYEYLGERKTVSGMRNFAMFLEDVSQHAPRAYLTPATRSFLHNGPQRHFEFHSAEELRSYTVLHLLAMRHIAASQPAAGA